MNKTRALDHMGVSMKGAKKLGEGFQVPMCSR